MRAKGGGAAGILNLLEHRDALGGFDPEGGLGVGETNDVFALEVKHLEERVIDIEDTAIREGGNGNGERAAAKGFAETLFGLAQLEFGAIAGGDIAKKKDEAAGIEIMEVDAGFDVNDGAILAAEARFNAAGAGVRVLEDEGERIIFVRIAFDVRNIEEEKFVARKAGHFAEGIVDFEEVSGGIDDPEGVQGSLEDGLEAAFAFDESGLGFIAEEGDFDIGAKVAVVGRVQDMAVRLGGFALLQSDFFGGGGEEDDGNMKAAANIGGGGDGGGFAEQVNVEQNQIRRKGFGERDGLLGGGGGGGDGVTEFEQASGEAAEDGRSVLGDQEFSFGAHVVESRETRSAIMTTGEDSGRRKTEGSFSMTAGVGESKGDESGVCGKENGVGDGRNWEEEFFCG